MKLFVCAATTMFLAGCFDGPVAPSLHYLGADVGMGVDGEGHDFTGSVELDTTANMDSAYPADESPPDEGAGDSNVFEDNWVDPDVCVPNCDGKECGTDGCGGICGGCVPSEVCGTDGICVDPNLPDAGPASDVPVCGDCLQEGLGAIRCDALVSGGPGMIPKICEVDKFGCLSWTVKPDCDDNNVCTEDHCDNISGECRHTALSSKCDDGDPCTVDSCNPITGCRYEPVVCESKNLCKKGTCDPTMGGSCTFEDTSNECDDGDPCTVDSCDPDVGCVYDPIPNCVP